MCSFIQQAKLLSVCENENHQNCSHVVSKCPRWFGDVASRLSCEFSHNSFTLPSATEEHCNRSRCVCCVVTLIEVVCVSAGEITDVQVPDSVPVDLRAKIMVCLIHLRVYTPLEVNGTHRVVIATVMKL